MSGRRDDGTGPPGGLLAAVTAAMIVLSGALVLYHLELEELSRRAGPLAEAAEMAALEDRLVGRELPRVAAAEGLRVVWAVDISRCAECLGDLSGWRRLARLPGVDRRAVLVGAGLPVLRRAAHRTGLSGTLAGGRTAAALREVMEGSTTASLALLVDHRGRVLTADARDARTACTSDPMARIGALVAGLRGGSAGAPTPGEGTGVAARSPNHRRSDSQEPVASRRRE